MAFLCVTILALLLSMGVFTLGGDSPVGSNFKPFFFADYFNWAMIMAIVSTVIALIKNFKDGRAGLTHSYAKKFPLLRFCTARTMVFCFLLGTFFIARDGNYALIPEAETNFGIIYP